MSFPTKVVLLIFPKMTKILPKKILHLSDFKQFNLQKNLEPGLLSSPHLPHKKENLSTFILAVNDRMVFLSSALAFVLQSKSCSFGVDLVGGIK